MHLGLAVAKKSRQIVLVKPEADAEPGTIGQMQPMGKFQKLSGELEAFNTAGDGVKGAALGTERLYGPGFTMQMPASSADVTQILVSVTEQDTAWPVLSRICRTMGWRMQDMETGAVFG